MVKIKTDKEIELMKESCKIAAETLNMIEKYIEPGITTIELNQICHEYILSRDCYPSPLYYKSSPIPIFSKSICTSLNDVICHGIPTSKQKLRNGDIINIDVTVYKGDFDRSVIEKHLREKSPKEYFPFFYNGYHGDTNRTYLVGKTSPEVKKLVEVTYDSMMKGIEAVRPGAKLGDIGHAIQSHAESYQYSVVREFTGHGIGRGFHEEPSVYHHGQAGTGMTLKKGMTFTVEPMVNMGKYSAKILKDGWTAVTADGSLSAQFEHTIVVTDNGYEILTLA
jgi:methionyl aminopeptidase